MNKPFKLALTALSYTGISFSELLSFDGKAYANNTKKADACLISQSNNINKNSLIYIGTISGVDICKKVGDGLIVIFIGGFTLVHKPT